jgi:hypothetical protein
MIGIIPRFVTSLNPLPWSLTCTRVELRAVALDTDDTSGKKLADDTSR